ncbi:MULTISPECIES: hypothetical protein [unclassified Frankia]|uniref:hypothetical protein n=1 Tax=unclassified Frankia TaxID=2632575 RepID=UPI0020248F64
MIATHGGNNGRTEWSYGHNNGRTADGPAAEPHRTECVIKHGGSVPEGLVPRADARTGPRGCSDAAARARARRVHARQLREIVEEYEREHGPLDIDGVQDALAEWPDSS